VASKTRSILAAIKTALQAINGSGVYSYNLSSTDQVQIGRPRPENTIFPSAWINIGSLQGISGDALINMKRTLVVELEGRVSPSAQTAEERGLAATDLLDDLVTALESDQSLGGLVDNLEVSGIALDGDEVGLGSYGVAYAQVAVTWEQQRGTGL
jgi:hypothetical protein